MVVLNLGFYHQWEYYSEEPKIIFTNLPKEVKISFGFISGHDEEPDIAQVYYYIPIEYVSSGSDFAVLTCDKGVYSKMDSIIMDVHRNYVFNVEGSVDISTVYILNCISGYDNLPHTYRKRVITIEYTGVYINGENWSCCHHQGQDCNDFLD